MKAKKTYLILGILIVVLIGGYSVYGYIYKDHRDIASEKVDFELKPSLLKMAMSNADYAIAYEDKVVQINGAITSVEKNSIIIDDMVQVNFSEENLKTLSIENKVIIKGRCVGYDDLLELVKIDQATIINN